MTFFKLLPGQKEYRADVETWIPNVDIIEKKDSYKVYIDLPGFVKEDFKVNIKEEVLTVTGERKEAETEKDENLYSYYGRPSGAFSKSFRLPENIDSAAIKGTYTNGVLEFELPKKEEVKPKTIEIK